MNTDITGITGPSEYAVRSTYAEYAAGAPYNADLIASARAEDAENQRFRLRVFEARDTVRRALEVILRDAPGSATETLLRRWDQELNGPATIEPMPEGVFAEPRVVANLLDLAANAYVTYKIAQRGGIKT
jgi:hypothetical protein